MRTILFCLSLALFVVVVAGCGPNNDPAKVAKAKDQPTASSESTETGTADVAQEESESATEPSAEGTLPQSDQPESSQPASHPDSNAVQEKATDDVREVGPPELPSNPVPNSDRETEEAESTDTADENPAASESPLRDIPLPEEEPESEYVEIQTIEIPKNWTRITPEGKEEVWIDVKAKQVMTAGVVCLEQGGLEMFICPLNTKEHESVIAVNARSYQIHAALLAMGIKPGKPVQWHPKYVAATGPVIEIDVMWKEEDSDEIKMSRAQDMVRNFRTKEALKLDWVFGGSVLETDEETGHTYYYADGGEMVCVSNFSTAMMDLPVESSDSNYDLLYEANPDSIPDPGTKVYVIFKPKVTASDEEDSDNEDSNEEDSNKEDTDK